jgi:ABC-type transporter Mla MlaB component
MKRNMTLTTTGQYASGYGFVAAAPALGRQDINSLIDLPMDGTAQPQATQVDPHGWRHTLILTGSLDRRSAVELQDELESLHQEGVTALTLDLRQLDGIDSPGANLIAGQGARFKKEGRSFAVIPGGLLRQGLLAQARLKHLLVNASNDGFVPRFANQHVPEDLPAPSTTMTKHLAPGAAEGV